jgi:hypothetical protein
MDDDSYVFARMFPCNHHRFPTVNSRDIAVVIDEEGVKLLDVPLLDGCACAIIRGQKISDRRV